MPSDSAEVEHTCKTPTGIEEHNPNALAGNAKPQGWFWCNTGASSQGGYLSNTLFQWHCARKLFAPHPFLGTGGTLSECAECLRLVHFPTPTQAEAQQPRPSEP